MRTLKFFYYLVKTSIRASISVRGAFILECALMIINNLVFFSMWWIFFQQFDSIKSWDIHDMAASMAILSGAYGMSQVFFGGVKNLGQVIISGDLDPFMTQPKNLLVHLIGSKSRSKGWGHLMSAAILLMLGGFAHTTWPLILVLMFSGSLIFTAFGIMLHSLTFWIGPFDAVAQKYLDSLYLFALYPTNIYSGLLQLLMFTLIPAGLIGYLPVELIRAFTWPEFFLLLGSSCGFLGLSFIVFYRGLKKYESGNQFGMRL